MIDTIQTGLLVEAVIFNMIILIGLILIFFQILNYALKYVLEVTGILPDYIAFITDKYSDKK